MCAGCVLLRTHAFFQVFDNQEGCQSLILCWWRLLCSWPLSRGHIHIKLLLACWLAQSFHRSWRSWDAWSCVVSRMIVYCLSCYWRPIERLTESGFSPGLKVPFCVTASHSLRNAADREWLDLAVQHLLTNMITYAMTYTLRIVQPGSTDREWSNWQSQLASNKNTLKRAALQNTKLISILSPWASLNMTSCRLS